MLNPCLQSVFGDIVQLLDAVEKKTHHIAYLPKPSLNLCSNFSSSGGMIQRKLHCFTMFPLTTYMLIYDIYRHK